jgi:hypothetical protein
LLQLARLHVIVIKPEQAEYDSIHFDCDCMTLSSYLGTRRNVENPREMRLEAVSVFNVIVTAVRRKMVSMSIPLLWGPGVCSRVFYGAYLFGAPIRWGARGAARQKSSQGAHA